MPLTKRNPGVEAAGRHLRLITGGAEPQPTGPAPTAPFPLPGPFPPPEPGRPKPPPSIDFPPLGIEPGGAASLDLERQHLAGEVERLTARCAELEHENRRLAGDVERARAAGERAERERTVRTMGHRLPSILTGGR